ncbi:hypothetical protein LZK98_11755 [Sphingomonas cannabina]|uniref:hypothetical protein n=1 Tax=Sphingomonas cannabina TaxID=2899123 RepID=UPI001F29E563|nr:hypothetical protein [Sphingomonas cannabina]UIJ43766.1 hypothetical protein LZK98_11755 [Sphingomonas cannabina]
MLSRRRLNSASTLLEISIMNGVGQTTMVADFSQSRNDMYWKVYAGADGVVRWIGYDDANWWQNVAKSTAQKVGKVTGRIFTLDYDTNIVTVGEPA